MLTALGRLTRVVSRNVCLYVEKYSLLSLSSLSLRPRDNLLALVLEAQVCGGIWPAFRVGVSRELVLLKLLACVAAAPRGATCSACCFFSSWMLGFHLSRASARINLFVGGGHVSHRTSLAEAQ